MLVFKRTLGKLLEQQLTKTLPRVQNVLQLKMTGSSEGKHTHTVYAQHALQVLFSAIATTVTNGTLEPSDPWFIILMSYTADTFFGNLNSHFLACQ